MIDKRKLMNSVMVIPAHEQIEQLMHTMLSGQDFTLFPAWIKQVNLGKQAGMELIMNLDTTFDITTLMIGAELAKLFIAVGESLTYSSMLIHPIRINLKELEVKQINELINLSKEELLNQFLSKNPITYRIYEIGARYIQITLAQLGQFATMSYDYQNNSISMRIEPLYDMNTQTFTEKVLLQLYLTSSVLNLIDMVVIDVPNKSELGISSYIISNENSISENFFLMNNVKGIITINTDSTISKDRRLNNLSPFVYLSGNKKYDSHLILDLQDPNLFTDQAIENTLWWNTSLPEERMRYLLKTKESDKVSQIISTSNTLEEESEEDREIIEMILNDIFEYNNKSFAEVKSIIFSDIIQLEAVTSKTSASLSRIWNETIINSIPEMLIQAKRDGDILSTPIEERETGEIIEIFEQGVKLLDWEGGELNTTVSPYTVESIKDNLMNFGREVNEFIIEYDKQKKNQELSNELKSRLVDVKNKVNRLIRENREDIITNLLKEDGIDLINSALGNTEYSRTLDIILEMSLNLISVVKRLDVMRDTGEPLGEIEKIYLDKTIRNFIIELINQIINNFMEMQDITNVTELLINKEQHMNNLLDIILYNLE